MRNTKMQGQKGNPVSCIVYSGKREEKMEEEKLDAAKNPHNDWGEGSKEVLQEKWRDSRKGL